MARTFNKVILIGNLGRDPETRTLPSGVKVTDFSIATSESYTSRNGEKVEQTTWFRAEAWDRLADVAAQYLKKGDQVYLEGRLRLEEYTDKEGTARTSLRLRISEMNMLGGSRSDDDSGGGFQPAAQPSYPAAAPQQQPGYQQAPPPAAQRPQAARPAPPQAPPPAYTGSDDDDLPF